MRTARAVRTAETAGSQLGETGQPLGWNESLCILEVLRDDGSTRLLRVEPGQDGTRRRLVKLRSGMGSSAKAVCLHSDHEVVSRHDLACALTLERLEGSGQDACLFFDDPGGELLDDIALPGLRQWLVIATAAAEALIEVHAAGLVHRDLRPETFIWNGERIYITDFSRAVRIRREHRDLDVPDSNTHRLRYMAPELTGRFNRPVDYRADYYSLGAVLYTLLVGQPPFSADDAHELIYQHLAVEPVPPRARRDDVPEVVSRVVLRLMEKDPDGRYQHGEKLLADLRLVADVIDGRRADDHGLLSGREGQRPLDIPHRLYGRETERRRLMDSLERAFEHRPQLVLIAGASGIGKTTLIRETYLPVTRQRAFFVSGKFDQLKRARPYGAWLDALEDLVAFIIAEPAETLEWWRGRLCEALGAQAGLLTALSPSMQALLGEQPPPGDLPPAEAKERFRDTVLRLFRVFSEADRPLVVFLDDLQWIDDASLELLETLVQRLEQLPLLIIAAYRDDEVPATHPLMLARRTLQERGRFTLSALELSPLTEADVTTLLTEGARRSAGEVAELAKEVLHRSGGNPFFIWQLLRTMRDRGWLFMDDAGQWCWDLDAVRGAGVPDQVVDLMLHRLHGLPRESQQLLSWAACLGTSFDLDILAWLAGREMTDVYDLLRPVLDEEFILPVGDPALVGDRVVSRSFRFAHDRMQEVAYRALPEEAVEPLHLRIAHLLRERLPAARRAERVIEIAGHLNLARSLVSGAEAGTDLARVNLDAARRAKAAAAFAAAVEHMRAGMSRLPGDIWERDPALAYALYRERGELEYLNSDFEAAERYVSEAIARETDIFRRADLYYMRVVQCTLRAHYTEAVAVGREALAQFGEVLPEADLEDVRDRELAAVRSLLEGRPLESLGGMPAMTDRRRRAVMKLLIALGPPCYRAHPGLWSVIVAREVRLCLESGNVTGAAYSYPAYGGLLTHVGQGDGGDCAALYRATRELMAQFTDRAENSMAHLMMGSSLTHWFAPLQAASEDYLEAYRTGQASGNLQYAVYGFGHDTYCRYFRGEPLDELIPDVLSYLEYTERRRNLWGIDLITGALRVFSLLHGGRDEPDWLHKHESETDYLARCEAHENLQVLCIYHIMRAMALLQLGEVSAAAHSIGEAETRLDSVSVQGLLPVTQFPALRALVLVQAPEALDADDGTVAAALEDAVARYGRWRRHAPDNFEHWYRLMQAEQARRDGDVTALIDAYDDALQAAQRQSCWPAAALIARRAALYWRERGRNAFAGIYEDQLAQAFRQGRASAALARFDGGARADEPAGRGPQMDAVIQIAQALSLHTELDELVPEIIRNVALQTGAQRVVLLLARDDDLRVAMDSGIHGARYYDTPPLVDNVESLPRSVIRYVARTQRMQRFGRGEVEHNLMLANDRYLNPADTGGGGFTGTAWCVPLTYLGELIGVLYLEHALTAEAFDERQRPLIEFLAAQAAISVRNIELIDRLAEEGRARQDAERRMQSADAEISARRAMEERLKHLANTDALTELANRRMFIEALELAWRQARDAETPAAVLMVDIDHFKDINDRHGHAAGDEVLRHLAGRFRATLRAVDIAARIGGEEFAVLLGAGEQADAVADRLCRQMAQTPVRVDSHTITFTVSIGVAHLRRADSSHEAVLQRADQALYRAKRDGRNRVATEL
ncbi:Serine/threonine-protein kinase PknD [wastewater metagenome]|uniref:Serine/threonine-protein kinase PknD n=5 Tax=root TaxID=1 RepID=A0A5B8R6T6_9ZZZZ|nr:serine/threonine-protein kinase PknD [uncultured organism]